jgi:hypothetical protein
MESNPNPPATAHGERQIAADPRRSWRSAPPSTSGRPGTWSPSRGSSMVRSGRARSFGGRLGRVRSPRPYRWSILPGRSPGRARPWASGPCRCAGARPMPAALCPLGGVLGGPAGRPAPGFQPQDPGHGHPQRPVAPQGRGRTASRPRGSGLRAVTLTVRFGCELALLAAIVWDALVASKARWPVTESDPGGDRARPVRRHRRRRPRGCRSAGAGHGPWRRCAHHLAAQRVAGAPGKRQTTRSVGWVLRVDWSGPDGFTLLGLGGSSDEQDRDGTRRPSE